jgi:hypothetical protein
MQITFEHFQAILEKWGKHLEICFHAKTSGTYSYNPGEVADMLWQSLASESPDMDDLFDRFISELQIRDFKEAYSSPEKLLDQLNFTHAYNCELSPYEAIKVVGQHAKRRIVDDGLLASAVIVYDHAVRLKRVRKDEVKSRTLKPGFVYFIRSDSGKVKIGRTASLENRMKAFSVTLPSFSLEHFFETNDMVNLERKFHELFADRRLDRELFEIEMEILASLKNGEYDNIVKESEGHEKPSLNGSNNASNGFQSQLVDDLGLFSGGEP